jgi:glycosyltransferase involved in cell wall biosynthesis
MGVTRLPGNDCCLVMIVRNEASVIARCLESVKRYISYWVIADTGSIDATKEIVREILEDIPGELHEDCWKDFGHNRTINIQRSRGKGDYLLLMNADEVLNVAGDFPSTLEAEAYLIRYEGDLDYHVPLLVRSDVNWYYEGSTHEHIAADRPFQAFKMPQLTMTHFYDGGMRKEKYQRDIDLLEKEVAAKPENARAVFYLAQSYRDIGSYARAMELYERRATMGGWDEEVWYAAYQVGRMRHLLGMAWPLVLDAYLAAYAYRPARLEPLYYIAKHHRENGEPGLAYLYARMITETAYPDDLLFIERNVYEKLLPGEYRQCCEALGKQVTARPVQAREE